ncbi:hypothetical protein KJ782_07205 [Patescibacteria group bacterium]|nr:hypothetical protein [Patescibacteria group bacterium]
MISLVTDGMLYPVRTVPRLSAPDGAAGTIGDIPVTPCDATGGPTNPAPTVPTLAAATGPSVPSVPCVIGGEDPTITPPTVPVGTEASETMGTEAPAVPSCPKGEPS